MTSSNTPPRPTTRQSLRLMLTGLGCALILIGCGGTGSSSAAFDGDQCEYSGPESVRGGDLDVKFENNSDSPAALAFLNLVDESARAEESAQIGTRVSVDGAPPGGAIELMGLLQAEPGTEESQTAPLPAGTYFLDCVTFSADGAPDEVWRVAAIEVEG